MRDIKFRAYVKIVGQICEVESINFDGGYIESKAFTQPMLFEHVALLQFTGLTDKNGVDIYEGDIVNIEYNYIGTKVVKFESGAFNVSKYCVEKCKVVGNIHQNPELTGEQHENNNTN